jgi:histidinol-phosphatase (PHP family)
MYWDTHMHTNFSGDSDALPQDMVQAAITRGLSGICLTDHEDLDYPYDDVNFDLDLAAYEQAVRQLQGAYGRQIEILYGIELGLQPHLADRHSAIVSSHAYDYVIGSSHLVHGKDPYYPSYYENRTEREAYEEYFRSILENISAWKGFDVYGHIDYVVRYGPNRDADYSYAAYRELIDPILTALIDAGKGIEVNTAGWKYGLSQPNPCADILRRYRELGGEIITTGADAHKPEHIAYDFQRLPDLLKSCGFRYYTIFRQRRPVFLPLP